MLAEEIDQITFLGIAWLAFAVRGCGAVAGMLPALRVFEVLVLVCLGKPVHVTSCSGPRFVGGRTWLTGAIAFGFASLAPCLSDAWACSLLLAGVFVRAWACVVAWPGRGSAMDAAAS